MVKKKIGFEINRCLETKKIIRDVAAVVTYVIGSQLLPRTKDLKTLSRTCLQYQTIAATLQKITVSLLNDEQKQLKSYLFFTLSNMVGKDDVK